MIKAEHNKLADLVFNLYINRLLKKSFVDYRIINELPKIDNSQSLLVTPNHFSWWDGFFVYWSNKKIFRRNLFVLMLEEQLKRYWFFKKLGCYSIDLNNNQKMVTSLKYTIDLLIKSRNLVTIYPQGEIQAYDEKQIILKEGITFIAKNSKITFQILPIAFKIHYSNEKLPIIYLRFGNLLSSKDVASDPKLFNKEFVNNLALINSEFSTQKSISIF